MVITELMEGGDEIRETNEEKVQRVVWTTGYQGNIDTITWKIKRLGQPNPTKKRLILVVMEDTHKRNDIKLLSKHLKSAHVPISSV